MELTGTLKLKRDEQVVNDRFRKREFVLTVDDRGYQQYISFICTQDKCDLLNDVNEGDTITVLFNVKGREWISPQREVKYFNSLEAWRINKGGSSTSSAGRVEAPEYYNQSPAAGNDDLPF
ncbi:MAG: hypothetical protein RL021_1374 [Bacteroidota bacterium]|jgi:hypothetical protein